MLSPVEGADVLAVDREGCGGFVFNVPQTEIALFVPRSEQR